MGRGIIESGMFRTEQLEIEQRTADPASPEANEEWLRVDIKPQYEDADGNTQTGLAEYRVANGDGTIDTAPVATVGDAVGENVIDKDRLYVDTGGSPTGTGFIPHATEGAAYPKRRLEHPTDGRVAMHNALTTSAIPDSVGSYEDGDISAYGGDTGSFSVTDSPGVSVPDGSYVLDGSGNSVSISTTDVSIGQGDTIRANVYIDSANEFSFLFGAQNENSWSSYTGYAVKGYENDSFTLIKLESGSSTGFGSSTWTTTKGDWLEIEVAWQSGGTISAEVFDSADNSLGTVSGSDSTWSSGGFGWKEYGGRCYHDYIRTV